MDKDFVESELKEQHKFAKDGLLEELEDFLKKKPSNQEYRLAKVRLNLEWEACLRQRRAMDWKFVYSGVREKENTEIRRRIRKLEEQNGKV